MSGTRSSNTHDVMISYNWGSKETVYKIRDTLKQNGITFWIDEEQMSGSIMDAMSAAVENCTVFLMCYSEKYSQSQNCKSEAEYAIKKKKIIVPCKMEKDYEPSGWLGFILGTKLFFDFSGKYPFELPKKGLLREIKVNLEKVRDDSLAKKVDTSLKMEDDPIENCKGTGTKNEKEKVSIMEGKRSSNNSHHVMISYNWSNQKSVLNIRDNLRKKGISCWMDIDNKDGSALMAMTTAVENCTVFLMCYSAKYSKSLNCRTEAEYAVRRQKTIIPCRMQQDEFNPSSGGWLGSIIHDRPYYDFSGKYPFEQKIRELLSCIEAHLHKQNQAETF